MVLCVVLEMNVRVFDQVRTLSLAAPSPLRIKVPKESPAVSLALPAAGVEARSVLAALIVLALAGVRRVRALWRPLSGSVGLIVSQPLRPRHRAWFVTAKRAESVVVTSRRGPRVVIATMADGPAEGITVRRTRVFLVPVDRAARTDGPR